MTTHKTHNRQTSKPPTGFEPTTSAGERPQTYAVDGAATGIGTLSYSVPLIRSDDIMTRFHFESAPPPKKNYILTVIFHKPYLSQNTYIRKELPTKI